MTKTIPDFLRKHCKTINKDIQIIIKDLQQDLKMNIAHSISFNARKWLINSRFLQIVTTMIENSFLILQAQKPTFYPKKMLIRDHGILVKVKLRKTTSWEADRTEKSFWSKLRKSYYAIISNFSQENLPMIFILYRKESLKLFGLGSTRSKLLTKTVSFQAKKGNIHHKK